MSLPKLDLRKYHHVVAFSGNIMKDAGSGLFNNSLMRSDTELSRTIRANLEGTRLKNSESCYWSASKDETTVYLPNPALCQTTLTGNRHLYDITAKLIFLKNSNMQDDDRQGALRTALHLLFQILPDITNADLFVLAFPNIAFDAEDEDVDVTDEDCKQWLAVWQLLEEFHKDGKVKTLGLSEFGTSRLQKFLPLTQVKPSVDQINLRDCCIVPKPLIIYAKEQGIQLLTHSDCTDILPDATFQTLLTELTSELKTAGEFKPQWVLKYTAVIKDRGVVDDKGYIVFASSSMERNGE